MKDLRKRKLKILFILSVIFMSFVMLGFLLLYIFIISEEDYNSVERYVNNDIDDIVEEDEVVQKKTDSSELEVVELDLKERVVKNLESINNCEIEHTYLEEEEGMGYASSFTFEFNNIDKSDFVHKVDFTDGRAFVSETWKVDWHTTFGSGQKYKKTRNFKIYVNDEEKYYLYTDYLGKYTSRKDMENKGLKVGYYISTHKGIEYYENYFTEINNVLRSLENGNFKKVEETDDTYVFEVKGETPVAEAFTTDSLSEKIDEKYKDNTVWYTILDHFSSAKYYVDKETELPYKIVINYSYELESEKFEPLERTVEITETYELQDINEAEEIDLPQGVEL